MPIELFCIAIFRAITLIRNLLSTHEADSRLLDPSVKARVASLYLPLIGIVLDASAQLYDPYWKGLSTRNSVCYGISNSIRLFYCIDAIFQKKKTIIVYLIRFKSQKPIYHTFINYIKNILAPLSTFFSLVLSLFDLNINKKKIVIFNINEILLPEISLILHGTLKNFIYLFILFIYLVYFKYFLITHIKPAI